MILAHDQIRQCLESGAISIDPFEAENLREGSYSFTLSDEYIEAQYSAEIIDLRHGNPSVVHKTMPEKGLILAPQSFFLCQTRETLTLGSAYSCLLSGRRSCAQIGLNVLQSSQYAEPGTNQKIILEMTNVGLKPVIIFPGMKVVKGIFVPVTTRAISAAIAA